MESIKDCLYLQRINFFTIFHFVKDLPYEEKMKEEIRRRERLLKV